MSPPSHLRRNFIAFMVDYTCFSVALSFINPNAVLPAFARTLTDSEPLIGLIGTVLSAGWLLPQLATAALISGKPRKKPFMLGAIFIGRPLYLLLALTMWAGLPRYPAAMLVVFFACIGLFNAMDGISSVPWFDLLARAVPVTRRGRLVGGSQVLSGILGIGVGALVGLILSSPYLPYPLNYALLFALAFVTLVPAMGALSLLREPAGTTPEPSHASPGFLEQLGSVWRGDPNFRRLVSSRWLMGLLSLALPFYVLHATEVVGLPEGVMGWFVSAQMVGSIVASLVLGWLSERQGPRPAIWLGAFTAMLSPLLALGIHFGRGSLLPQAYPLVYFLFGATNSSWMIGTLNYLLEIAPKERRPLYMGLYNTLAGVLVPASFLGGVLLRVTSYPVLFGVTAVGVAAGLWLSLGLEETRQHQSSP